MEIQVHVILQPNNWQPRLLTHPATPDPCLCKGAPVLGAQLPIPSELCHLAESVVELWQVMEPLVSFTEEEVFAAGVPSNWVEVSLIRLAEPALQDPLPVAVIAEAAGPTQEGLC